MNVLLLIDIQNDFMPNEALKVPETDTVIPIVNSLQNQFDWIVVIQD